MRFGRSREIFGFRQKSRDCGRSGSSFNKKDAPEQEKESISPEENLILSRYPNSPFNDDKNCLPSSTPRRAVVEPDARSWPGAEVRRLRALRPQLTVALYEALGSESHL